MHLELEVASVKDIGRDPQWDSTVGRWEPTGQRMVRVKFQTVEGTPNDQQIAFLVTVPLYVIKKWGLEFGTEVVLGTKPIGEPLAPKRKIRLPK